MNKTRILLADGNTNMRLSLAEILRYDGCDIEEVEDGLEALKRVNTDEYELVIAEIKLPKMDGVELLERIKQVKPNLPVILVSGYGDEEFSLFLKGLGALNHFIKPINLDNFGKAISLLKISYQNSCNAKS